MRLPFGLLRTALCCRTRVFLVFLRVLLVALLIVVWLRGVLLGFRVGVLFGIVQIERLLELLESIEILFCQIFLLVGLIVFLRIGLGELATFRLIRRGRASLAWSALATSFFVLFVSADDALSGLDALFA